MQFMSKHHQALLQNRKVLVVLRGLQNKKFPVRTAAERLGLPQHDIYMLLKLSGTPARAIGYNTSDRQRRWAQFAEEFHGEGLTLRELGARHGVTGERARQILNKSGCGTRGREGRKLVCGKCKNTHVANNGRAYCPKCEEHCLYCERRKYNRRDGCTQCRKLRLRANRRAIIEELYAAGLSNIEIAPIVGVAFGTTIPREARFAGLPARPQAGSRPEPVRVAAERYMRALSSEAREEFQKIWRGKS